MYAHAGVGLPAIDVRDAENVGNRAPSEMPARRPFEKQKRHPKVPIAVCEERRKDADALRAKRVAAAAGGCRVRVFDDELRAFQAVAVIDFCADQVLVAHGVDQ